MLIRFIIGVLLGLYLGTARPVGADDAVDGFREAHGRFFHLLSSERTDLELGYRFEPSVEEDGGPGEYRLHAFDLELELPYALDRDFFLRGGFEYGARGYDFEPVASPALAAGSELLHRVELLGGAGYFLSDDFLLTGLVAAGTYTNFVGGFDTAWLDYRAEGFAVYRINPGAQLLLGVSRSQVFDEHTIVPLVGLRLLSATGHLHLSITAPVEARLTYRLNPAFELYAGGWAEGNLYHVEIDDRSLDLHVHDRRLGSGATYWITKNITLGLEAGLLWGSELEFKLAEAGQFDNDLKTAPYVAAGIGFAL
ncbi:MAG: hypothetical protein KDD69_14810 [Bdellovibrionales bacterium]|nr:hypothetical protein [Bdellovibrionales bacterium]